MENLKQSVQQVTHIVKAENIRNEEIMAMLLKINDRLRRLEGILLDDGK